MCQFWIGQSWFRKAQQVPCLHFLVYYCHCSNVTSCCIVECCASLAQAIYILILLSKQKAAEIVGQVSAEQKESTVSWSLKSCWRHVKRTGSQICLSISEESYLSHLSWKMTVTESVWLVVIKDPDPPWIRRSSSVERLCKNLEQKHSSTCIYSIQMFSQST